MRQFSHALCLLALLVFPAQARSDTQPPLLLGEPAESYLADDGMHVYEIEAVAAKIWRLRVTSYGNEARVEVSGCGGSEPGRAKILAVRTLFGLGWSETITWTAVSACRVALTGAEPGAPVGRYTIALESLVAADPQRLAAERLRTEALAIFTEAGEGAAERAAKPSVAMLRAAEAKHGEALAHWRRIGRREDELHSLVTLARIALDLGETRRAAELLASASGRVEPGMEGPVLAWLHDRTGLAQFRLGSLVPAREAFDRAQELWRDQGNALGVLWAESGRCLVDLRAGQLEAARHCYEALVPEVKARGERRIESRLRSSLGGVYANLGEPDLAIAEYQQNLLLSESLGHLLSEAQTRNNLAALYRRLGEPQKAIDQYRQALAFFRQSGDDAWQARCLNNLGFAYISLGDLARARSMLHQALPLRRAAGDRLGEAATWRNLARVALRQGRFDDAISQGRQALELATVTKSRRAQATTFILMASAFAAKSEYSSAVPLLERALEIRQQLGDRVGLAEALKERGRVRQHLWERPRGKQPIRELAGARADLEQALGIYRAVREPGGQVEALFSLAQIEYRLGRLAAARQHLEPALEIVESLRRRLPDPMQRASFLAARRGAYALLIDLEMTLHATDPSAGHDRAALAVSERARARSLLDLLATADADAGGQGVDPRLRHRIRAAQRRLDAKAARQLRVLGAQPDAAAADEAVRVAVHEALADLEALHAEAQRQSPDHALGGIPAPIDLVEIQALIDHDTVLVHYSLGEARSFLWRLTGEAISSFELPPRSEIETLARETYRQLTRLDVRSGRTNRRAAADLARLILPPGNDWQTATRLIVVPDGALHYVPFATLPIPSQAGDVPLLARYEIVQVSSGSALVARRRLLTARAATPTTASVAVLADPVFDARDPRVRDTQSEGSADVRVSRKSSGLLSSSATLAATDLPRLRSTRHEAHAIAALVAPEAVTVALDFDANREWLMTIDRSRYRVLHLATHGILNPANPEHSGMVLSRVDAQGRARDGFLSFRDVLGLDLDLELVVLSGCQTALGREIRGEGLLGLARGFLYAGVPRVMASLWQVQDRATAHLMSHFYRRLLVEGMPPAKALRAAQLVTRQERRWQDSFFWGAFVLQGDWR